MDSPLRILQLTNRIPFPLTDGGNIASYHVTYYLNKAGHKVTLASLNTKKHHQDPAPLQSIAEVVSVDIDTSIKPLGLFLGVFSKMPYNVKRFKSAEFEEALIRLLTENTFDIIQLEGSYMALYLPVLRQHSSAKIVLRSHNIEHEIWQRMALNEINPLKKWYFNLLSEKIRQFENTTMHGVDAIAAITSRDKEYYQQQGFKGELVTINAGANLSKFQPDFCKTTTGTLCFLAGMDWMPNQQGLDWFLDTVWPEVKNNVPEIRLHIAGKAMPEKYYYLDDPSVEIHGLVPDAVEYLQKYEIFIVPLLSGGGMRLKVVEGMAVGKCILSTTVGAEGVEYSNKKNIVIADTPQEWIAAIISLLKDPQITQSIGQEAAKLAMEKYNWENLVDNLISLYRRLN
ncbi:MAG: glycosyltransferase [Cytophaga sp.]|uniref:glycosyltransferase n=1 Tax=Cytophaga sp. TaxID=29535 RepID=UPI003F804745